MALIDTPSIVEDLIAAGFAKSQAEALTRLKILHYEDLASKKDLENIERSVYALDAKISIVTAEIAEVKHNLDSRMDKIDTNLNWIRGISIALLALGIKIAFFNN